VNPRPESADPEESDSGFRLGLLLFLASLTVFFGASIIGYLFIRLNSPLSPPPGHLALPRALWASTGVLLVTGWALHMAHRQAQEGRIGELRWWLGLSFGLGGGFIAIQFPCLLELWQSHRTALARQGGALYGLTSVLIVLHGMHVLGGMAPLGLLAWRAWRHTLGPAPLDGVRGCALYWHFLEAIWIVLFGMFLITA